MSEYRGFSLRVDHTDSEHRGYFEEAKKGRLVVQRCTSCSLLRGAIGAACPFCSSLEWSWHAVSGMGSIYSWQIVNQSVDPAMADAVPYVIVLVQLDEQQNLSWNSGENAETVSVRVVANLWDPEGGSLMHAKAFVIGDRVEACFIDLNESAALPQFRLVSSAQPRNEL